MKTKRIRPFNIISALFFVIAILLSASVIFLFIEFAVNIHTLEIQDVFLLPFMTVTAWVVAFLFRIAFLPFIDIKENCIEIRYWENGTPYDKKRFFRWSRLRKATIQFDEIALYGGFFTGDIKDQIQKREGFLYDQWTIIKSTSIPIPVKLPLSAKKLRDVLMFVKNDGDDVIVDAGLYGLHQVQNMFYLIERRTGVSPTGRVQAKEKVDLLWFNIIKSFFVLAFVFGSPIFAVWLEGLAVPSHLPSRQSFARTVYVIAFLLANFFFIGYYSMKRNKTNEESPKIGTILSLITTIFYIIFAAFYLMSMFNVLG